MRNKHVVLAWSFWLAFACVLGLSIYRGLNAAGGEAITALDVLWATSIIGFPTAGAIIASRQPRSPLGWLFLTAPLFLMIGVGAGEQARVVLRAGESRSAEQWGWFSNVSMSSGMSLGGLMALLIPNGKLPSRGWRIVAAIEVVIVAMWVFTAAFRPGPLDGIELSQVTNPYGLEGWGPFLSTVQSVLAPVFMVLLLLSLASIPLRLLRASDEERLQLKWVAYGAAVVVACVLVLFALQAIGPPPQVAITLIITVAVIAIPVAIGIAMLRYRLYDVDVVINRTLVYGLLSAVLAGIYVGLVFAFQGLLAPFTAESDLAIAASTLAVAALFRPVRTRVQAFIDRRFYRRKVDAQQTLDEFTGDLRDEVDLPTLSGRLTAVVNDTMQPAHVSLWLRTGGRSG